MAMDVGVGEQLWNQLVDQHVDAVWRIAVEGGLGDPEAATVSQLTWLRMAERWPTVRALARTKDPTVHPADRPADQVDEWILHTARTEVDALVDELGRRERAALLASGAVVQLGPGFRATEAVADPDGRR